MQNDAKGTKSMLSALPVANRHDHGLGELKKHVAAIHIKADLTLVERKLANVLLLNAYDDLPRAGYDHTLPVHHLLAMLGWDKGENISLLQRALRTLATTSVEFNLLEDGKTSWHVMTMLSYGEIKGGQCTYRYDKFLAEQLYNPEIYATINLRVQRLFDSGYALALYENCLRFRNVGSTGWWPLATYRALVGAVSPAYDQFKALNRMAVKAPVEEINRVSDIRLEAEVRRFGRKVTDIRFLVSPRQKRADAADGRAEGVQESELFGKLRGHGIGARLAAEWIRQDEARARATVEYVEARARKKEVKGSTAGYIRTVFESGAELGPSTFEADLKAKAKEEAEARKRADADRRAREATGQQARDRAKSAALALSPEQRAAYMTEYRASTEAGQVAAWNEAKGDFRDATDRIAFNLWLQKKLSAA